MEFHIVITVSDQLTTSDRIICKITGFGVTNFSSLTIDELFFPREKTIVFNFLSFIKRVFNQHLVIRIRLLSEDR